MNQLPFHSALEFIYSWLFFFFFFASKQPVCHPGIMLHALVCIARVSLSRLLSSSYHSMVEELMPYPTLACQLRQDNFIEQMISNSIC
jgi:hypothetical protein